MNKVVFNNCCGYFSLSVDAVLWLARYGHGKIKDIAQKYLESIKKEHFQYGCYLYGIDRHDPDLVRCVETLGSHASGSEHAHLEIAEIKGNCYRIDKYDGAETVYEPKDEGYITIE